MRAVDQVAIESLPRGSDFAPADLLKLWNRDNPNRLIWDFNLPPSVDGERIVVNIRALNRAAKGRCCFM